MTMGLTGQTGSQIVENVAFALNHGYDLIDTANRYGNEAEVGEGLKKSGRKLCLHDHGPYLAPFQDFFYLFHGKI